MSEEKISDLHKEIEKCLLLLPKYTNESNLKKTYREETGVAIHKKLDEINEKSLHDFLRFKCADICTTYRFDKEIKIDRKPNLENDENTEEEEAKKRHHHKKNTAPKLNIPKAGILQNSTFRRSNPQGFNKMKPRENNKNLINTYKHPNYVKVDEVAMNVDTDEYAPTQGISLADFVPLDSNIAPDKSSAWEVDLNSTIELLTTTSQQPQARADKVASENSRPNVRNASDFPSLPHKNDKIGELFDEPKETSEGSGTSNDKCQLKCWNEVTKKSIYTTPPARRRAPSVPPRMMKKTPMENLKKNQQAFNKQSGKVMKPLNKPVQTPLARPNRPETPFNNIMHQDFIIEEHFKLAIPNFFSISSPSFQSIFITQYTDPSDFYFQYCEISLCRLIQEMKRFYKTNATLMVNKATIRIGLICAVNTHGIWARAEVAKPPDYTGNVKVFLSDFAYYVEVNIKDIRYLFKQFCREPMKCVKGKLAGIKPFYTTWTLDAIQRFRTKVCGQEVFGSLVGYSSSNSAYLLEICEQLSTDSSIGNALVKESLGKVDAFKQNNGILI